MWGSFFLSCDRNPPALGSRVIHSRSQNLWPCSVALEDNLLSPFSKHCGLWPVSFPLGDLGNQEGRFLSTTQSTAEWGHSYWQQLRERFLRASPDTFSDLRPGHLAAPRTELRDGTSRRASLTLSLHFQTQIQLYTGDRAGTLGDSWQATAPHSL